MDDKEFSRISFIALGLFLAWWLWERKRALANVTAETDGVPDVDPNTLIYSSNPGAYNPANLGDININIANQGLGYLSNQYIPLFGFVGMAQGVAYG